MKIQSIISLGLSLAFMSCGHSIDSTNDNIKTDKEKTIADIIVDAKINVPDTSNQNIYDFMKIVIADQKLDLNYGLSIEPENNCNGVQEDQIFLKTLLFEKTKLAGDTVNLKSLTITYNLLPKCLNKGDIADMLLQKEKLIHFTWDNSRLGFNLSNKKNWYNFSRPLFSKDRKKAIMMIECLCPGLCGTGWTVLFSKQNDKWTSQKGEIWIH